MRNLIYSILAWMLALGLSSDLYAQEKRFTISLASKHSQPLDEDGLPYNEVNPGIGFEEYFQIDSYVMGGFYDDSHDDLAFFAGVGHDLMSSDHFALCMEAAFVFGPNYYGGARLCGRASFAGHNLKIGYAPMETIGIGHTDTYTLQYQKEY